MNRTAALILIFASAPAPAPAAADVVSASSNGMEIRQTVDLTLQPEAAYQAFTAVGAWWDPEHTYSGDANNLSLNPVPGGCFCERNPKTGGGVEHMRVAYVEPGKRIVLTGSLGPLLYEATTGAMDVQFKSTATGTQLTLNYKVAGFAKGGAEKLAPIVDRVIGTQVSRLRAYAATRPKT